MSDRVSDRCKKVLGLGGLNQDSAHTYDSAASLLKDDREVTTIGRSYCPMNEIESNVKNR